MESSCKLDIDRLKNAMGLDETMTDIRPRYNWPETIFVHTNTPGRQIDHIISEVYEMMDEGRSDNRRLELELADLHHSIETFWRIVENERGSDYVQGIFDEVAQKNQARSYYSGNP